MTTKSIFILFYFSLMFSSVALSQDERKLQPSFFSETFYQSRKMIKTHNFYGEDTITISDTIVKVYDIAIDQGLKEIRVSSYAPYNGKKYKIVRTELENGQERYICKVWRSDIEYAIWISSDENQLIIVQGQDRFEYILEPREAHEY